MPTYEYRCNAESCRHEFELFQSITADPAATCPECAHDARRLISAGAGLLFKGSGFYITDYRSKAYTDKARAEGAKKSEKKAPKGGAKKSDSSGTSSGSKETTKSASS